MVSTYLIYNPDSGGKDRGEELRPICDQLKAELVPVNELEDRWSQIQETAKTVIAAGGDGTVNAVAGKLAGTDLILGVIPAGTLNHFAKDLGLPMPIDEAVAVIAKGNTTLVDTAQVNGQVFINNSSLGVYPDLVKAREKHAPQMGKWPAAVWGLLAQLPAPRAYHYSLTVDGKSSSCHTPFIFVGNNSYNLEEAGISNRANLVEGKLCVYIIKTRSRLKLISMAARSVLGVVEADPGFERFEATELEIAGHHRKTADVAMDGEVKAFDFPLKYTINPRSLRVITSEDH